MPGLGVGVVLVRMLAGVALESERTEVLVEPVLAWGGSEIDLWWFSLGAWDADATGEYF